MAIAVPIEGQTVGLLICKRTEKNEVTLLIPALLEEVVVVRGGSSCVECGNVPVGTCVDNA